MIRHWYKTCPTCRQGRLFIEYDTTEKRLVLHCEECEYVWRNPEFLEQRVPNNVFQALTSGHDFAIPEEADIDKAGWAKYKLHVEDDG